MRVKARTLVSLAVPLVLGFTASGGLAVSAGLGPGVGVVPQGLQSDAAYAGSFKANHVTNVFATTQQTSCYTPEVPYSGSLAPADGYTGESGCAGAATTGEALGPYPTQSGSNTGYPATTAMLVKDHSESDLRVDPTNASHLIGSSKWVVSAEGYNHLLGFYESFDGGKTWPVQGHIPGYEGWTDNTDPIGAFDGFGNYYEFILPYQFFYDPSGSKDYGIGTRQEPNPAQIAEVVAMAVRPHGATAANDWITTRNGKPDFVATYDSIGNEPDKQWMTIDTNPRSPHYNRIYAMWVDFHNRVPVPFVSFADALPDGTHSAWTAPLALPTPPHMPQGETYLLPHVDGNGNVYTTLTNFEPAKGFCCVQIFVDKSTDGGASWSVAGIVGGGAMITPPPLEYANTQFRDGIENTFAVGTQKLGNGSFPLYVSYEDYSAGVDNVVLTMSSDSGATWSSPIQVTDNASPVDAFQPNLTVAANGTLTVAFYDRRLACPSAGTAEAAGAGIALDTLNLHFTGSLPPYGAANYCVNSSIQFYDASLNPIGHNIRTSAHTWDPQLNEPKPGRIGGLEGFIGDYYGNITSGSTDYTTSVSTFDEGSNPNHYQQQVIATIAVP
jgi:hypothetical protein